MSSKPNTPALKIIIAPMLQPTPPTGKVLVATTPEDGEIVENAAQGKPLPQTATPGTPATPGNNTAADANVSCRQHATRLHTDKLQAGGQDNGAAGQLPAQAAPPQHGVRVGRPRSNAIRLPRSPLLTMAPPGLPMPIRPLPAATMIAAPPQVTQIRGALDASDSADLWMQVGPTPPNDAMLTPVRHPLRDLHPLTLTPLEQNKLPGAGEAELDQQVRRAWLDDPFESAPNIAANSRSAAALDRKRTWAGSPTTERTQRGQPKRPRTRAALPSERDLLPAVVEQLEGNPWASTLSQLGLGRGASDCGDVEAENTLLENPIATSTPALSFMSHDRITADDPFLDNQNESGHPPTPHRMDTSTLSEIANP